jgi:putative redox protein
MAKLHAKAKLIQDFELALDNGRAHALVADQPSATSPGVGATPLELCVMSHAGCYVTIAALVAKRMHLNIKGCEVTVDALKSEEADTIVEETFDITYTSDASEDQIKRLHEHTLRNCPVGILFERAGVKIAYNVKTQKE